MSNTNRLATDLMAAKIAEMATEQIQEAVELISAAPLTTESRMVRADRRVHSSQRRSSRRRAYDCGGTLKMNRIYLGDGVYVHIAHYGLVLTVEDGLQVGGEIALSEKAYAALVAYVDRYVTHGNTVAKETESK